jgi:adenosylhomocysteine nucleosidase
VLAVTMARTPTVGRPPAPASRPVASDTPLTSARLGFAVALGVEAWALGHSSPNWTVEVSGPGPVAATAAAQVLVARGCDAIISWGVAGGLSPELSVGDLVVPERVRGEHRVYDVDCELRARFIAALTTRARGGTLVTTDRVVQTRERKSALHRAHGAVAVDTESAALAEVAADNGLGFAAIRVISDAASDALPSELAVALNPQTGGLRAGGLVRLLVGTPRLVPQLVRTGRDFGRALATLRTAGTALRVGRPESTRQ